MRFPINEPYVITNKFSKLHPGIDIAPRPAGQQGRLCYAPEDAYVYTSATGNIEGNYIILKGKSGVYYYFGHFATRMVNQGHNIKEGAQLGTLGETGLATGIHTHHEIRPNGPGPGASIDPEVYYAQFNNKENDMFPNEGDLQNFHNRTGWPGHPINKDDIAYWTTGTGNDGWAAGADNVWKDLTYSVTLYVLNKQVDDAQDKLNKIKEIVKE